jgi:hypothetical protein
MSANNPFYGETFAERRAIREAAGRAPQQPVVEPKQVDNEVDEVEDKAISAAQTKKRTTRKKS